MLTVAVPKRNKLPNIIVLTPKDGAAVLEVSRQTIGSLENGRYNPSILLAFKIAKYFGCQIEDVFFYEPEEGKSI